MKQINFEQTHFRIRATNHFISMRIYLFSCRKHCSYELSVITNVVDNGAIVTHCYWFFGKHVFLKRLFKDSILLGILRNRIIQ